MAKWFPWQYVIAVAFVLIVLVIVKMNQQETIDKILNNHRPVSSAERRNDHTLNFGGAGQESQSATFFTGVTKRYCNVHDTRKPVNRKFRCVDMKSDPSTPLCLNDAKKDIYAESAIKGSGTIDSYHYTVIQKILRKDPNMAYIDVGCHIGFFALIMAKMGRKVVCVEPSPESILRIHRSAQLGNLTDNMVLVENAISDTRGRAAMEISTFNQANNQVDLTSGDKTSADQPGIGVIKMDDLLEVITFKKAMMKMDIQGFEHRAILGALRLLERISLPYISIEWTLLSKFFLHPPIREPSGTNYARGIELAKITEEQLAVEKGIVIQAIGILTSRGYKPHNLSGTPLKIEQYQAWPNDVLWIHKDAPKL